MAMNLKDEIIGGESYSLEFKLVPNEDRIKYLKTVYRTARKNCDTEEERRTVKRITPDQLEAWGILSRNGGMG